MSPKSPSSRGLSPGIRSRGGCSSPFGLRTRGRTFTEFEMSGQGDKELIGGGIESQFSGETPEEEPLPSFWSEAGKVFSFVNCEY